jgi:hypothetical protein
VGYGGSSSSSDGSNGAYYGSSSGDSTSSGSDGSSSDSGSISLQLHAPVRILQEVSVERIYLHNAVLIVAKEAALFLWSETLVVDMTADDDDNKNDDGGDDNAAAVLGTFVDGSSYSSSGSMLVLEGDLYFEHYQNVSEELSGLVSCKIDEQSAGSDTNNPATADDDDAASTSISSSSSSSSSSSNDTQPYRLAVLGEARQVKSGKLLIETLEASHRQRAYLYVATSSGWEGTVNLTNSLPDG